MAQFLEEKIHQGSHLSVVSAYFTIYAYDALKDSLDRIEHLNFLFGEPTFVNRLDPSKTASKSFILDAAGLELANKLQQKRVARECAHWIESKVAIRTVTQSNLLHGKMYHVSTAVFVKRRRTPRTAIASGRRRKRYRLASSLASQRISALRETSC